MRRLSSLPADLSDLAFRTVRGTVEHETICGTVIRSSGATHTRELWVRVLGGGEWRLKASVDVAAARRGHRVEGLYVMRGNANLLLRFRNLDTGHDGIERGSAALLAGRDGDDPTVIVSMLIMGPMALGGGGAVAAGIARVHGDAVGLAVYAVVVAALVAVVGRIVRVRRRVSLRQRRLLERALAYGPQEQAYLE
ncbi:MAG TPA: hypothetical protein VFH27_01280 [Longimicrobiaceae bacterium]|nr:hypothetical protein [Longimicrobiaceae bacterium]